MPITLGPNWQTGLWASQYSLRFELGTGGSYINMFTSSYDRARRLARAALPTDRVTAVIAAYPHLDVVVGREWRGWTEGTAWEILSEMGVPTEKTSKSWLGYWWPGDDADEEASQWDQRAVCLPWDQVDILIWNQIAHEIGIGPQAPVMTKFVDLERGVVVNAYDDRGMDITALEKSALTPLMAEFDEWLLDYDRPRMVLTFDLD